MEKMIFQVSKLGYAHTSRYVAWVKKMSLSPLSIVKDEYHGYPAFKGVSGL